MAAIIAPIVARDEAESMLIKSANRTIQVRLTQTSSDKTQPDPNELESDPTEPKPGSTKTWSDRTEYWPDRNQILSNPDMDSIKLWPDPYLTQTCPNNQPIRNGNGQKDQSPHLGMWFKLNSNVVVSKITKIGKIQRNSSNMQR